MRSKQAAERQMADIFGRTKWLTETEAAAYLKVAPITLRKWRANGQTSKGEIPPDALSAA